MQWSALRDRCQSLGLLDAALADAELDEVEGNASIDVFQLRQRWWDRMLDRLDHAADGKGLAEALRLIETAYEAGGEQQALDELFRRHGGRRDGGRRILDYREYVRLRVEVRRRGSGAWETDAG